MLLTLRSFGPVAIAPHAPSAVGGGGTPKLPEVSIVERALLGVPIDEMQARVARITRLVTTLGITTLGLLVPKRRVAIISARTPPRHVLQSEQKKCVRVSFLSCSFAYFHSQTYE